MKLESLQELYVDQLRDLYDAEQQVLLALPALATATTSPQLRDAFEKHLLETRTQVTRLEDIFDDLGIGASGKKCKGIRGIIEEGEEAIGLEADTAVKDAALIASAQRVEHYEMSGYGSARAFARQLGETEAAEKLSRTLEEEKHADEILTQITENMVNQNAAAIQARHD
jgi:ferritin-like metal-binding protein YciE